MENLISSYEKNFIIDGVQDGIRNDGRGPFDYRHVTMDTGVLASTSGSARVRIGLTDVLVAVKAEMTTVERGESIKKLRFFIDFSATAGPRFAGRGGSELAEELAKTLESAYDNNLVLPNLQELVIAPTQLWVLFVDVTVLQYDGNAIDAISLGVKSALTDTKICRVIVRPADEGKILLDLPDETNTWSLDVSRAPLIIGVSKIGDQSIVDATLAEELCSTSTLYVGVQPSDSDKIVLSNSRDDSAIVTCVRMHGGGSLEVESIEEMVDKGVRTARTLNAALMERLKEEAAEKHSEMHLRSLYK